MPTFDRAPQIALILIGLIAVVAALEMAETFFAPVVLALVGGVVLSPMSATLERFGMPPVLIAILGMLLTLIVLAIVLLAFQPVVAEVIRKAPKVWADVRETLEALREAARGVTEAVDDVQEALQPEGAPKEEKSNEAMLSVQDAIVLAPALAAQIFVFAGTLFFFLLTRRPTYEFVAHNLAGDDDALADRLHAAEHKVSQYLLTITCINATMGVIVAAVMYAIGLPNPVSWGLAAAILNFVLYLGPVCIIIGLLFAGIAEFNGFWAIIPAASYLFINAMEAQFVTPAFVGRNMSLNPLAVFLSLTFWLWLWGPVGGVIAIPIMVWLAEMYKARHPVGDLVKPHEPRTAT